MSATDVVLANVDVEVESEVDCLIELELLCKHIQFIVFRSMPPAGFSSRSVLILKIAPRDAFPALGLL